MIRFVAYAKNQSTPAYAFYDDVAVAKIKFKLRKNLRNFFFDW